MKGRIWQWCQPLHQAGIVTGLEDSSTREICRVGYICADGHTDTRTGGERLGQERGRKRQAKTKEGKGKRERAEGQREKEGQNAVGNKKSGDR